MKLMIWQSPNTPRDYEGKFRNDYLALSEFFATYQHVFGSLNRHKSDKRDLHGQDCAKAVNGGIRYVYSMTETAHNHQCQNMQRDQVDQEDVASPRRYLEKMDFFLFR